MLCFSLIQIVFCLGNGHYDFLIANMKYSFYADFSKNGEIWIRLNYKNKTNVKGTSINFQFKADTTTEFLKIVEKIGWSDSLNTISREQSWILENFSLSSAYLPPENISTYMTNIFNGNSPTGAPFSESYSDGYVYYGGILRTYGSWTSMFYGCGQSVSVGSLVLFRTGGDNGLYKHLCFGEYIHHKCNDYTIASNSITSKIGNNNTRVLWAKVKIQPFIETFYRPVTSRSLFLYLSFILI